MIKLLSMLEKYQPSLLFKDKDTQKRIKLLHSDPYVKQLKPKIKTCLDFYQANLIKQGLLNKLALEKDYETIRINNDAIWDNIFYQEKKLIAHLDGKEIREKIPSFEFNGLKIFIPFFDERLNHYYTNDMAIFEKKQYFDIYRNFTKFVVEVGMYGHLPYQSFFASCYCIASLESNYVLYDVKHETMTVLLFNQDFSFTMQDNSEHLAQLILNEDVTHVVDYLMEHKLLNKKCEKKLRKGYR